MKILLVEDEKKVAAFIRQGLSEQSWSVDVAHDGVEGEELARQNEYDLLVVDIMLPRKSGFSLVRAVRSFNTAVPILMLTALDSTDDKVQGFEAGADDYLVKPFEFPELLARIRALLRRASDTGPGASLCIADLEMDLRMHAVKRAGVALDLTSKEYALLEYLMRNRGRVVSRAEITEHVWETWFDSGSNVVDVYVSFLRKKLEQHARPRLLHTVIGAGYVMKEPDDEDAP